MLNMRLSSFLPLLIAVIMVLACRSEDVPRVDPTLTGAVDVATATPAGTHAPTAEAPTSTVTATPGAVPTDTPAPPSPTSPAATATPVPSPTPVAVELAPVDDLLAESLRGGGHVIYLRITPNGDTGRDLDACLAQRVVGDDVLARARAIGVAFQQLELPVGRVLSGNSCAELVTARVAFGGSELLEQPNDVTLAGADEGANVIVIADLMQVNDTPGLTLPRDGDAVVLASERDRLAPVAVVRADEWLPLATRVTGPRFQQYPIPAGSRPHDVAPATDGGVWYTAQGSGELGWLDPVTGETLHIPLGSGSAPHGVIVGPDGAPWITDSGLNAIVRVDPRTHDVQVFGLPPGTPNANLNTAAFDATGMHWFTGQNGYYGRLDPATGEMQVWESPRGRGPYGIDATPAGDIYYASLAGSHIALVDTETGAVTVIDPPTAEQGARRVWSDSQGHIWVSEWNSGQVSVYDPASGAWREWMLPGDNPRTYAVYVDEQDIVWLSDFGANALVRFDPTSETFESFALPATPSNVRQILGRPHEVWGAESAADTLVVLRVP